MATPKYTRETKSEHDMSTVLVPPIEIYVKQRIGTVMPGHGELTMVEETFRIIGSHVHAEGKGGEFSFDHLGDLYKVNVDVSILTTDRA